MNNYSIQNVRDQLDEDQSDGYQLYLLKILKEYKDEITDMQMQMLKPEDASQIEYLEKMVDAALAIILRYKPIKRNKVENNQESSFSSLFME